MPDRRHRAPKTAGLSFTALPDTPDPLIPSSRFRPSHGWRLGLALTLSLVAHGALFQWLTHAAHLPSAQPATTSVPPLHARLKVRPLARPAATSQPAPPPPTAFETGDAAAEPPTPPSPAAPAPVAPPTDAATSDGTADATIPDSYLPLARLTREPQLLTEVDPSHWPALPDTPSGVFRLELGIGSGGRVERIVPLCEPALCAAAERYAEIVREWQFQPAEALGRPMPSRLTLEFQVGIAPPPATDQPLRQ